MTNKTKTTWAFFLEMEMIGLFEIEVLPPYKEESKPSMLVYANSGDITESWLFSSHQIETWSIKEMLEALEDIVIDIYEEEYGYLTLIDSTHTTCVECVFYDDMEDNEFPDFVSHDW